jgi:hypothetical protein
MAYYWPSVDPSRVRRRPQPLRRYSSVIALSGDGHHAGDLCLQKTGLIWQGETRSEPGSAIRPGVFLFLNRKFYTSTDAREFHGYIHFAITIVGAYLLCLQVHYIDLTGMPRRYIYYTDGINTGRFAGTNVILSICAQVLFMVNLIYSLVRRKKERPGRQP